jgi:hypothetical protein
MTTVMFLSRNRRELDYHFMLWDFDTEGQEELNKQLQMIDAGKIPGHDNENDEDTPPDQKELDKVLEANSKTSCCSIF